MGEAGRAPAAAQNGGVDDGVARADAHLDELRRRVYARGATPEAAREYADALARRVAPPAGSAAEAPAAPPPVAPPARRPRWAAVAPVVGLAAAAALAAALSVHPPAGPRSPARAAETLPSPPPVPGAVLATLSSVGAGTSATLDAKGHTVVLASLCNGDGTVTIRVGGDSTTVLACARGMPALVMVRTTKALGRFTVSTTSEGRPHWALTVGTFEGGPS